MGSYSISTVTAATLYPVSLAQAKEHLRISHDDDNTEIKRIIKSAVGWVQTRTNRYLGRNVVKAQYWGFSNPICLPSGPIQEIESIVYLDSSNSEVTLAADQYELDPYNRQVRPAYGVSWPSTLYHWNAVQVTYGVGYYDATESPVYGIGEVPEDLVAGVYLAIGDMYENRESQQDIQLYKNEYVDALVMPYRIMEI